jgi:hypothetical protein
MSFREKAYNTRSSVWTEIHSPSGVLVRSVILIHSRPPPTSSLLLTDEGVLDADRAYRCRRTPVGSKAVRGRVSVGPKAVRTLDLPAVVQVVDTRIQFRGIPDFPNIWDSLLIQLGLKILSSRKAAQELLISSLVTPAFVGLYYALFLSLPA